MWLLNSIRFTKIWWGGNLESWKHIIPKTYLLLCWCKTISHLLKNVLDLHFRLTHNFFLKKEKSHHRLGDVRRIQFDQANRLHNLLKTHGTPKDWSSSTPGTKLKVFWNYEDSTKCVPSRWKQASTTSSLVVLSSLGWHLTQPLSISITTVVFCRGSVRSLRRWRQE